MQIGERADRAKREQRNIGAVSNRINHGHRRPGFKEKPYFVLVSDFTLFQVHFKCSNVLPCFSEKTFA